MYKVLLLTVRERTGVFRGKSKLLNFEPGSTKSGPCLLTKSYTTFLIDLISKVFVIDFHGVLSIFRELTLLYLRSLHKILYYLIFSFT